MEMLLHAVCEKEPGVDFGVAADGGPPRVPPPGGRGAPTVVESEKPRFFCRTRGHPSVRLSRLSLVPLGESGFN